MAEALHRKNMIDVFDHFPEALFAVAFVVRSSGCSDFIATGSKLLPASVQSLTILISGSIGRYCCWSFFSSSH